MLAGATLAILFAGTGPIAYIREFSSLASSIPFDNIGNSCLGCQLTHIRTGI
jgi:hypothetical protein